MLTRAYKIGHGKQCSTRRMYMIKGRISTNATRRVTVSVSTVLLSQVPSTMGGKAVVDNVMCQKLVGGLA